MPVDSGDGDGVPQAQIVKLVKIRIYRTGGIHLIHRQNDGLSASQQHVGHLVVGGGEAGLHIGQKDNHRGVINGQLRLLAHKGQDLIVRLGLNAAGVDQGKRAAVPVRLPVNAVAGDARRILHDGEPPTDQLVEQHGLAHIGPTYNGNDGFHGFPPVSLYSRLPLGCLFASASHYTRKTRNCNRTAGKFIGHKTRRKERTLSSSL
ncbi:hypothetical protein SDC9_98976 [bioreactor metagenome]|uniref:Uncharacterized protein n=1 Tax=bioreactor metagenome TaxID=1076179 RepID=A0A645AGA5_9ZZZZ